MRKKSTLSAGNGGTAIFEFPVSRRSSEDR